MTTFSSAQKEIPAGMIDLSIGQPSPWLLPAAAMQRAAAHCAADRGCVLLAYGAEQGDGHFRVALSRFLEGIYGMPVDPAHLFVTNGASQAIDMICTLFSKAGDTIFVEEPTYFLARKIFADHQLKPVALPMDADGLIIEAVEEELTRSRPAFLYTIPTYHNPTSACLSVARRKQLAELCRSYDILVVADEVYHPLSYTSVPPPPLAAFCTSAKVISLGSFSKILAPGLRLGWLQAAPETIGRIVNCGLLDSGGGAVNIFELQSGNGHDSIFNFHASSDKLEIHRGLNGSDIRDTASLASHIHVSGNDVSFDLGGGNSVTLVGVDVGHLSEANLTWV